MQSLNLKTELLSIAESNERNNRRRRAEAALDATSKRAKLAASVDEALIALASNWNAYAEVLRKDVGQVSGAGGDLTAVERALTNNRSAEPLIKALIAKVALALLGLWASIPRSVNVMPQLWLDAEGRVAESLRVELLRIKASSPSPMYPVRPRLNWIKWRQTYEHRRTTPCR